MAFLNKYMLVQGFLQYNIRKAKSIYKLGGAACCIDYIVLLIDYLLFPAPPSLTSSLKKE